MASSVEIPSYHHESLTDPRIYIRLLQICSIDESRDVPVHCQLTVWAVDTAPAYTAISYTWGDPDLLESILVDGKKMEVRQNCGYVLRQTWRLKRDGHIWIDAICINQTDNHEKSPQVAMMGTIYRKAVQTLACVGRHENDSEFLCEMMHKKSHWWSQNGAVPLCFSFRRCHLWGLLLRRSSKARLLKAFNSFLERQYFRRVWIYQELYFGRDIKLCCGTENFRFPMLFELHRTLLLWTSFKFMAVQRIFGFSLTDLQQYYREADRIFMMLIHTMQDGPFEGDRPFDPAMLVVATLQCEDPRDRVYGILGMIDWKGVQPIEPDYSRDRFDLASEFLRKLGGFPDFNTLCGNIKQVATNLRLTEEPSDKLNDAIRERLLRNSSHIMTINPQNPDDGDNRSLMRFWGLRLLYPDTDAPWQSSQNTRPSLQLGGPPDAISQLPFPTMQKWSKGSLLDLVQADILLPQDAQPLDWMLVPSVDLKRHAGLASMRNPTMAFLARSEGDHRLRLINKVLIFPERLWPRPRAWEQFWGQDLGSAKFGVHIDAEDLLMLGHSSNWDMFRSSEPDPQKRTQLFEKYLETRLFGTKGCPYAIPMDF